MLRTTLAEGNDVEESGGKMLTTLKKGRGRDFPDREKMGRKMERNELERRFSEERERGRTKPMKTRREEKEKWKTSGELACSVPGGHDVRTNHCRRESISLERLFRHPSFLSLLHLHFKMVLSIYNNFKMQQDNVGEVGS